MSLDVLRRLILTLNGDGARRGLADRLRQLRAAIGRAGPVQLVEAFEGLAETSARFDAATAICLDAEDFERYVEMIICARDFRVRGLNIGRVEHELGIGKAKADMSASLS